jgi:hypothetical protein
MSASLAASATVTRHEVEQAERDRERLLHKRQKRNQALTETVEIAGRGHALTIDSGWHEVADTALAFVRPLTS